MTEVNQNINKDMIDSELIDLSSWDVFDVQTWLNKLPDDSGQNVDFVDWSLSCDWPINKDDKYLKLESDNYAILDNILKNQILAMPDKHKFDSRTYVKPKKRSQRPSIQSIMEVSSNPSSLTTTFTNSGALSTAGTLAAPGNKYLTYNKYSMPLGPISPMLRLKTFNVDTNSDNSHTVKEYATKRRSLVQDEDPQLEDVDVTLVSDNSERLSSEHVPSKPINIDLSQPAHNLHNTFNKGLTNMMNERGSLNMYQSGESLMRMSPPSLVSSLMEGSGTFHEALDGRRAGSMPSHRDSGLPGSGRESIDPMITSMTLSILDEKDMNTSFLSQTTHPDNDSFMDSLPPSLVNSVNSSFVVSQNIAKSRTDNGELNVFSSPTYTHLDQTDKLLTARPRINMFNSYTKRDSAVRKSESYTKSREESCQIDTQRILNENNEQKESPKKLNPEMSETITLHTNNKFRCPDAEKENVNASFEKDDAFYRDMGLQKTSDLGKDSLNVTLDKQELNEIIQARQKLSLARKALPSKPDKPIHSDSPNEIIQVPNQIIKVPKKSMENASELLSRRRAINSNGFDRHDETIRELPKRNATFKIPSPKSTPMDATVVYVKTNENQMIDINSATLNLIDSGERTQHLEWNAQERAMVGSSESTDTGTFSSSSPPESVPDTAPSVTDARISSTPIIKNRNDDLLQIHSTISPIYDIIDDKSYTVTTVPNATPSINVNAINTTTMRKPTVKRDIMARNGPQKKILGPNVPPKIAPTDSASHGSMVPPPSSTVVRKTGLPTSKLRQYSSHKELSRIPGGSGVSGALGGALGLGRPTALPRGGGMCRRSVYASHPALSPTAPHPPAPPAPLAPPIRRDSYVIVGHQSNEEHTEPAPAPKPRLVRQATETLQRDKAVHKDRLCGSGVPVSTRVQQTSTRSNSIPTSTSTVSRPTSVPPRLVSALGPGEQARPASGSSDGRVSALPRPSRLPAPRRTLRPPSVYSVAHTGADMEQY